MPNILSLNNIIFDNISAMLSLHVLRSFFLYIVLYEQGDYIVLKLYSFYSHFKVSAFIFIILLCYVTVGQIPSVHWPV